MSHRKTKITYLNRKTYVWFRNQFNGSFPDITFRTLLSHIFLKLHRGSIQQNLIKFPPNHTTKQNDILKKIGRKTYVWFRNRFDGSEPSDLAVLSTVATFVIIRLIHCTFRIFKDWLLTGNESSIVKLSKNRIRLSECYNFVPIKLDVEIRSVFLTTVWTKWAWLWMRMCYCKF